MKVNYQYASPSMCLSEGDKTTLGLSPDNSRAEQVSFLGRLKHPLIFRDAMLMLRQIVISDSKQEKKPRTEFYAWLEGEIERRITQHEQYMPDVREELTLRMEEKQKQKQEKEAQIANLKQMSAKLKEQIDAYDAWEDYYKIERDFWKFIRDRDYDLWFVLDPVITVHPDQVSFEAFSIDESTYGCLSIPIEEFELLKDPVLGTTNIDFSAKLAEEMKRFRTYTDVTLSVNPDGFGVESGIMPEHIEKKIDLPETWIKGFSEVSSAACLEGFDITLTPADLYDICSFLRRHKEKKSPRYMKWILKPEQPVRILFVPFHTEVVLHAVYHGKKAREEKIWGRRRWLVAEQLLPLAKSFQVRLFGFGMPQFIIADLGVMKMTIGFSSWSANDWVKGTAFHIMAGFIGEEHYDEVYTLMKKERSLSISKIQQVLHLDSAASRCGIGMLLRRGEGYYDAAADKVRFRQLCSTPIPESLYEVTLAEKMVQEHLKEGVDSFRAQRLENGDYQFSHAYAKPGKKDAKTTTSIVIDTDGQINKVVCNCKEFTKGPRNISAPCSHILALYLMSTKFLGLPFEPLKIYTINDIMEMLL